MTTIDIGRLFITPGIVELMPRQGAWITHAVRSHSQGDWGDIDAQDRGLNEQALLDGSRLFGVYKRDDVNIWIITVAADDDGVRQHTTVLLPGEY